MVIPQPQPGLFVLLVCSWLFSSPLVLAGIVNRTIDDSFGDSQTGLLPTYLPSTGGVWKDQTCIGCAINPDTSQTFKGTYTAATYNPGLGSINITMQFNGTAIYVYFVLVNNAGDGITSLTLANFTLDGNTPQLFQHAPDLTTTDIQYNQLAFSQINLINAQHTLVVSTSGVNTNVYVNFDYAIYTHDDDAPLLPLPTGGTGTVTSGSSPTSGGSVPVTGGTTAGTGTTTGGTASGGITTGRSVVPTTSATTTPPTSSNAAPAAPSGQNPTTSTGTSLDNVSSLKSHVSTGAIAGGVIGGIIVLILLAGLIFFLRRRKRQSNGSNEDTGSPPTFMTQLDPERDHQAVIISPFTDTPSQTGLLSLSYPGGYGRVPAGTRSELSMPLSYVDPSTARSESRDPDGGSDSQANSSGSEAAPSSLGITGQQRNRPLRSVTSGDHLSSTEKSMPAASNNIEATRRARQNELDERLRTVQEEMTNLASDVSGGEKGGRHRSVRRQRTLNRAAPDGEEEEMSVSDMREQLRSMREQIAYLQDQQRSAWAQGLSDDPPPGYSPATTSARNSAQPPGL